MNELWPWLTLALLGAYHGINPAMGWLFAVALGLQERSRVGGCRGRSCRSRWGTPPRSPQSSRWSPLPRRHLVRPDPSCRRGGVDLLRAL